MSIVLATTLPLLALVVLVDVRTTTYHKLQVQQREAVSFYGGGTSPAPLLEAADKKSSC